MIDAAWLLWFLAILPLSLLLLDAHRSGHRFSVKAAAWFLVVYIWFELSWTYGLASHWQAVARQEAGAELERRWAAIWAQVGPKVEAAQPKPPIVERQKWTRKRWQ